MASKQHSNSCGTKQRFSLAMAREQEQRLEQEQPSTRFHPERSKTRKRKIQCRAFQRHDRYARA